MKKRLAIAQPAIIDTEIVPLTDSFRIEPNGQTEQWYYENSGAFAPDRRIIPLLITAKVTAIDTHTNTSYSSTAQQNPIVFYSLRWYVKEWNGTAWTRTEVTNTTDDTSHPYVKKTATNQLKVNKNVTSATHGIIIECEGEYIDPRDAGTTVKVIDSLNLTMNQEATIEYPQLDVLNESTRSYNPLRDTSSQYEFNAKADWKGLNEGNGSLAFKADNLGTEEITTAKTDAPASVAPILDVVYDKGSGSIEQTDQKFTYRKTGGGGLPEISKTTRTIDWRQSLPQGEYVDLGLPSGLLWCTHNVGATTPEGYGYYFSWGNIQGHAEGSGYNFSEAVYNATTGATLTANIGADGGYDMARENQELPWRLPTTAELQELNNNCTSEWVTVNGVAGRRFTSRINGNSVFFPASGYYDGTSLGYRGSSGSYWSSTYNSATNAHSLYFNSSYVNSQSSYYRRCGFSVRAVSPATSEVTVAGTGKIKKVKGNTAVWNQMANINTATAFDSNSITVTNNNNIFEINIIKAASGYNVGVIQATITTIVGHKYYFSYWFKCQDVCQMSSDIWGQMTTSIWAPANVWSKYAIITQATITGTRLLNRIYPSKGNFAVGDSYLYATPQLIDLTLMFGAGNEPTTVAAFEQWLDANVGLKGYYPYDAGSLIPVKDTTLKTVGFNLWDEDWEVGGIMSGSINSKSFTKVIPNTTYYFRTTADGILVYFYDINKNEISSVGALNTTFTTPVNCYFIKFRVSTNYGTTYRDDICINLSDASKNGTYEAHWENNLNIPVTTLKGRVLTNGVAGGSPVVMFPDGLNRKGSCYDEIDLKLGAAVRRYGKVHLKDVVASVYNNNGHYYCVTSVISDLKVNCQATALSTLQCGYDGNQIFNGAYGIGYRVNEKMLNIALASEPTTKAAFESALDGVYLYYEIETPIIYTFDPIPQGQFEWYGVSNGVEVKIDTLPSYVSGQNTDTLRIDALYGEEITVICRYRKYPWDANLIPQKVYRSVIWRIPDLDVIVVSKRGDSVRKGDTGSFVFEAIVNMGGQTISEEIKAANLHFKWKLRKSNSSTVTDLGEQSTQSVAVEPDPNDPSVPYLRNAKLGGVVPSTLVYCEVYLLGAYQAVTSNGVTTYQRLLEDI